jgi:hypothetical protein
MTFGVCGQTWYVTRTVWMFCIITTQAVVAGLVLFVFLTSRDMDQLVHSDEAGVFSVLVDNMVLCTILSVSISASKQWSTTDTTAREDILLFNRYSVYQQNMDKQCIADLQVVPSHIKTINATTLWAYLQSATNVVSVVVDTSLIRVQSLEKNVHTYSVICLVTLTIQALGAIGLYRYMRTIMAMKILCDEEEKYSDNLMFHIIKNDYMSVHNCVSETLEVLHDT